MFNNTNTNTVDLFAAAIDVVISDMKSAEAAAIEAAKNARAERRAEIEAKFASAEAELMEKVSGKNWHMYCKAKLYLEMVDSGQAPFDQVVSDLAIALIAEVDAVQEQIRVLRQNRVYDLQALDDSTLIERHSLELERAKWHAPKKDAVSDVAKAVQAAKPPVESTMGSAVKAAKPRRNRKNEKRVNSLAELNVLTESEEVLVAETEAGIDWSEVDPDFDFED